MAELYANNRLYWACKAIGIATLGSTSPTLVHGAQSLGTTVSYGITPIFEIGQLSPYENVEDIPNVEITMEKVIDGYPLIYHLATRGASSTTLAGRSNQRCSVYVPIFRETRDAASGDAIIEMFASGMYLSSVQYTLPVEGQCTESVTLVGNNRVWAITNMSSIANNAPNMLNTDVPLAYALSSGGVQMRENVNFTTTYVGRDANGQVSYANASHYATILPPDVAGISSSGTNDRNSDGNYRASIQNINVSANLNRDALYELGHKSAYFRPVGFPVEVSCDIEINAKSGDMVNVLEAGTTSDGGNLTNRSIRLHLQEGTFIDLGTKNKLNNISFGGGNAGGGIDTITYSFVTQNDFTVIHPQDPG